MPASDISRITHSFPPGLSEWARQACASLANQAAKSQVAEQIRNGALSRNDPKAINATYKQIYYAEYYRNMNIFEQSGQAQRSIYIEDNDRSARKFFSRHTVVNFSKLNCFIHVHRCSITVGRYNFPLDGDESPETKESFVTAWPGPLDKLDNQMRPKVIDYIDTLQQHDSLRRIKYCDSANDERRTLILNLLRELIRQNGSIDAAGITRLLLGQQKTEINKEDSNRKPIETIQKYLLLSKRADAIKFARSRRLFDHAQCLAFLDKYQPPNTAKYTKDSRKLKDDSIVLLNDDYISSIDQHSVLNTVYRALLNRILETDPESMSIIKRPNVVNNNYEFAILSANDCEMDFDQSNEVFKLIRASKRIFLDPVESFRHLIALGFTHLERSPYDTEPMDDISNRSHLSFKEGENPTSRTLIISNFDMLILNEIWEYCLNLARGTCNPSTYEYVTNLIPYKLVFASCLFDYGLHNMFAQYIESIRSSLAQAQAQQYVHGDPFYNWATIERSVEHLWRTWELFQSSPETMPQYGVATSDSIPFQSNIYDSGYNATQPIEPVHSSPPVEQNDAPYYNNYQNEWDVEPIQEPEPTQPQPQQYPPQHHSLQQLQPQQQAQQQAQQQRHFVTQESYQTQPFNMEPLANQLHSLPDMSRYQRPDYPDSSQMIKEHDHKVMKSSSPVNKNRESSMGDSFPFSPIQENVDPQSNNSSRRESAVPNDIANNNDHMAPQQPQASTSGNNNQTKSQPSGDQQNNFLANLVGTAKSLLPKSNSKPMILPDDTNKTIDYDPNLGKWVNRSDPNGALEDEVTDAPPLMNNVVGPPQYSFKKSSRGRYPTPNFH